MSRKTEERFNPNSLRIETTEILTCPKCGKEEVLSNKRREARMYTVKLTVSTLKEDKKTIEFTDLCSSCFDGIAGWLPSKSELTSEE